jgi:hypothetical protein
MADAHRRIWWVTKYGRILARLEDARFGDMFWVQYTVVDLTSTSEDQLLLSRRASGSMHRSRHASTSRPASSLAPRSPAAV